MLAKVLAAHGAHVALLVAPAAVLDVPDGHEVQEVEPYVSEKVPPEQVEQVGELMALLKRPGWHKVQVLEVKFVEEPGEQEKVLM